MSAFTSTRLFDDDGYTGYDARLALQQFKSFSNFDADLIKDLAGDSPSPPIFARQSFVAGDVDDMFSTQMERRGNYLNRQIYPYLKIDLQHWSMINLSD